MKKKIIYLYSHPIQYFAPLSRLLAQSEVFELLVCYCSDHGVKPYSDKEFNQVIQWDIPLLEGYESVFLKNYAPKPGIDKGFFGLMNFGILSLLWQQPKSYVIVHGWAYCTHFLTLLLARFMGHKVCLRGESPLNHEILNTPKKLRLRQLFFRRLLFPNIYRFLFIGSQNKAFYEYYGVKESKLIFTPYAIDNQRFGATYEQYKLQIPALKRTLGLPQQGRIVLFSGKFIDKKRPMDLLQAFVELQRRDTYLLFVGDGELRPQMETYIKVQNANNVILTGFVNQSLIPQYYALADIFVMCSQEGETWGLSTNEAMNFGMPVLLSDLTGSASDLVEESKNGFVFRTGNIEELKTQLSKLLNLSDSDLKKMGLHSKNKIEPYSYTTIIHNLEQGL